MKMRTVVGLLGIVLAIFVGPVKAATNPPVNCSCVAGLPSLIVSNCPALVPDLCVLATNCFSTNVVIGAPGYCMQSLPPGMPANPGTNIIMFMVTDGLSNSTTCQVEFVVVQPPNPTLSLVSSNKTVACGSGWSFDTPAIVSTCCDPTMMVQVVNTKTIGTCPQYITRTWQVTNTCGLSATSTQMVTVVDTLPPAGFCSGMNLVPNGQFENFSACPSFFNQVSLATPWFNPTQATSDYLNTCSSFAPVGVPTNGLGVQTPFSGQAYCGAFVYSKNGLSTNDSYREYIEVPLIAPLLAAQTYRVSFRVSLSETSQWAVADIGAHLSVGPIFDNSGQGTLNVIPQVSNPTNAILASTNSWMLVQGTFIAAGGEDHLTLGNFKTDPNTVAVGSTGTFTNFSYYYFDDVAVQAVCPPGATNKTVICGQPWSFDAPLGFDQCSGTNVVVTVASTQTNGTCPLVLKRTWLLTDLCGNTNTVSQTVTFLDNSPPMLLCNGNNLVPNPKFENFFLCPTNTSMTFVAYPWNTASDASPDYFNSCAVGLVGVPTNYFGSELPFSGQGYMGAYVGNSSGISEPTNCYREYLQVPLISQLVAGQTYPVSFRVSLADRSGYAIAEIGAHFSVGSISNGIVGVLNAVPQVVNPSTNLLTSTNSWMLVSGFYTAVGGETHMTLGNFLTDAATTGVAIPVNATNQNNNLNDAAYYYFDDVYVGGACSIAPLVVVPCGTSATFPDVVGYDACSGANVTMAITTVTNSLCPLSVKRTWTLTDLCGNTTNVSQTISNIVDTAPPVVLCGSGNLAPNPSFEVNNICPGDVSQFGNAFPWYQPTFATPDLFNTCATSNVVSVPSNFQGSQTPFQGQAYAGLVAYSLNNDYREYLQAPLLAPMVAGQTYLVSFRASLADSSGWAASELGVYFSTGPVTNYAIQSPLPVVPQIENPAGNPLTVTNGWMLVQGSYTAVGGESFITIGNFRADNATTVVPASGNETSVAYYYIDEVEIETPCNVLTNIVLPCGVPISFPDLVGYDLCSGTNVTRTIVNVTNSLCPLNIKRTWTFTDACGNSTNISQTMGALADTEPPIPICNATNYVPNPSFESYTNCPDNLSELEYAAPWYPPNQASPDYFNFCNPYCSVGVPTNSFGMQYPFMGQGYAGAYVRSPGSNYREYLETPLTGPLVTGQTYTVSFRVSLAAIGSIAISQIGAHLSVGPISGPNNTTINVVPQVINSATNFLRSTNGWMLIQGNYTAAGGENYLTLGNFLNDNATATTNAMGDLTGWSYYFFDEVHVSPAAICPPQELVVPCGQPLPFSQISGYDACAGTNVSVTIVDTTNNACPLIVTRTWTLADPCGNSTNVSQQIFVTDNQPPVVNCACVQAAVQALVFTNGCVGVIPDYSFLTNAGCVTDNCGPIHIFQSPAAGTLVGPGPHTVSLTFADCGGNSTNCSVPYFVLEPPSAIFCPTNIYVQTCSNSAVVYYDVNTFGAVQNLVCTPPPGSNFPLGTNVVTCTMTTACGQPITNTFLVIVRTARVTRWSCLTMVIGIPYQIVNGGSISFARMVNVPDFPGGGMGVNFENLNLSGGDGPRFDLGAAEKFTFSTELDFNATNGAGFDLVVPPGLGQTSGTPLLRFRRSCAVNCGWNVQRPSSASEGASTLFRSIAISTNGELFSSFTSDAVALNTNVLLNLAPVNGATSVVMTVTLDCRTRELMLDFPFCAWTPDAARKGWNGIISANGPRGGSATNKTARLILTPSSSVLLPPITSLDLIATNLSTVEFDNPSLTSMQRKWFDGHVTLMKAYDDGTERGMDFTSLGDGGGVKADIGHAAGVKFLIEHFQNGDVPNQEQVFRFIGSPLTTNSVRFTKAGGGVACAADFSAWGVPSVTVQLWNGSALVSETNVPATLATSLVTLAEFPGNIDCPSVGVVSLSGTNPVIVLNGLGCPGIGCIGTELRIIANLSAAARPPAAFTGLECVIGEGMDNRIANLQTTPACTPQPITANMKPGGVSLNWSGDGFRLQGAETVAGPWYDLGPIAPVTLPANSSLRLFRLRCD